MSSGSSSHEVAWASVERTKYLMFWKSMPDRSEPQSGIGLRPKSLSALSRRSSIHSGSFLRAEMSRTTSSLSPRLAVEPAVPGRAPPACARPRGARAAAAPGGGTGGAGVRPAVLVPTELVDLLVLGQRHRLLGAGH